MGSLESDETIVTSQIQQTNETTENRSAFINNHGLFARFFLYCGFSRVIRYDTRCYFNLRSKADMSQLNLLHGSQN